MTHRALVRALCALSTLSALSVSACASSHDDAGGNGNAGTGGAGGAGGVGAANGNAGTAGSDAGKAGKAGSAGSAGSAGTAGSSAGTAGASGATGGASGSTSAGGANGTGGTAGAGGTSGASGASGSGGTGGSAGASGSGGTAGSGGSAGSGGMPVHTPLGYSCADAIDLNDPATHGLYVVNGVVQYDGTNASSTLTLGQAPEPSCFFGSESSKTVIHKYTNTSTHAVELVVATVVPPLPSNLDNTVVWAYGGCPSGGELDCNDYDSSTFDEYGKIDLATVTPGTTVYIMVAGSGTTEKGRYRLTVDPVELLGLGEACTGAGANFSCVPGLICASDVPGQEVCSTPVIVPEGGACDTGNVAYSCATGLLCAFDVPGQSTCQTPTTLPPGSACDADNVAHTCAFPSSCAGAEGSQLCSAATILLDETFTTGLGAFTVVDAMSDGQSWHLCDPVGDCADFFDADNTTTSPSGGQYAIIRDASGVVLQNEVLQAGPFDTSALVGLHLRFFHNYDFWLNDAAYVEVSTDGTAWTAVETYLADASGEVNVNLTAQGAGKAAFWFRFRYVDEVNGADSYAEEWRIDDVTLYGQ